MFNKQKIYSETQSFHFDSSDMNLYKKNEQNSRKEILSFVTWIEKQISLLESIGNLREQSPEIKVNLKILHTFKDHFENEVKLSFLGLANVLMTSNPSNENKLIEYKLLVQKHYNEILSYPKREDLSSEQMFNEWYSNLVESLESASNKLHRFAKRLGFFWDPIKKVALETGRNNFTFTTNINNVPFENYVYYEEEKIYGDKPSSYFTAA